MEAVHSFALPLRHFVGSQHLAGCAHRLSLLALHRLSQRGLFMASSWQSVWGCWPPGRLSLLHPTSALSLPPLPLCADVSVSLLGTQALGLGLFCSNVSSSCRDPISG